MDNYNPLETLTQQKIALRVKVADLETTLTIYRVVAAIGWILTLILLTQVPA